jgi:hypothetical protein
MNTLATLALYGIIITGQSNMCGVEPGLEIEALRDLPSNVTYYELEDDGTEHYSLHTNPKLGAEVSAIPAIVAAYPASDDWVFVKVCKGGQSMKEWKRDGVMWDQIMAALDNYSIPSGIDWKAVILMNGEKDRHEEQTALFWDGWAEDFMDELRIELNAPNMDLIFSYPGYVVTNPGHLDTLWDTMVLFSQNTPNTHRVNMTDLSVLVSSDGVHLKYEANYWAGLLFAQKYIDKNP